MKASSVAGMAMNNFPVTSQPAHPAGSPWRNRLARLEIGLARCIEVGAALLIALEIVTLFAGVVARYFFHAPLIWTDEVGAMLFLWIAVLGSVIAFHRGEHMRMTALVQRLPAGAQALVQSVAMAAPIVFLLLLLHPAFDFAHEEIDIVTPALEISSAWRAFALPIGLALMALMASLHWWRSGNKPAHALQGLSIVVLGCIGMTLLAPQLQGLGNLNLVIFFVGVTASCVLGNVPIAIAFGLATLGYLALTTHLPLGVIVGRMDEGMSHIALLSVPLFVFLGLLIEMTGMARAMVAFLASLLGHVRGGLSYVLIGAMYLVSGISGSKVADMAAVAPVLFPEMRQRGARDGELVAMLAASGAQTETIPPSLVLITIGSVTGVSIAALFAGGMLPGLVMGLCLCVLVGWRFRHDNLSHVQRASLHDIARATLRALPAIALPFVIRAAVVQGIATATEVSTLGIVYAALAGLLFYRQFDWKRLLPMLVETATLSGAILFIIGTATGMAWSLTQSGFSAQLATFMGTLPGGSGMFLFMSVLVFIVLGSVLEGIPAIVLFGPLMFPIARQLGIHEVHYAMVVVLSMGIGLFTPPFGVGYYAACAIARIEPKEGMQPITRYVLALLFGLALVTALPWISTALIPTP